MDYSKMSDFEINCMVARYTGLETMMFFDVDSSFCHGPVWNVSSGVTDDGFKISRGNPFNPCNNPADAWPIIMKSGINVFTDMIPHGLLGQARASMTRADAVSDCIIVSDKNPLRAAMIVFLMMQESANVPANTAGPDIR